MEHILKAKVEEAFKRGGLARGLSENVKAIERGRGLLCIRATNCNCPLMVRLVEALCEEHNVSLTRVITTLINCFCYLHFYLHFFL